MDVDESLPGFDATVGNGRPPWVKFHWGTHVHSFRGGDQVARRSRSPTSRTKGCRCAPTWSCRSSNTKPDANWGPQNPTSGTPKPHRTHQVQVGDTLDRISARYFGDSTHWRDIAALNSIADPLDLTPGRLLSIPERNR